MVCRCLSRSSSFRGCISFSFSSIRYCRRLLDLGRELPGILFGCREPCGILLRKLRSLLESLSGSQILFVEPDPIGDQIPLGVAASLGLFASVATMFWYIIQIFMKARE